ncbi:MAG: TlpA family protein disulfide reductase [Pseudomonadota bacterium]|nr:TlpA family protein disulfide reductase [Pseudomonadota bacterium]
MRLLQSYRIDVLSLMIVAAVCAASARAQELAFEFTLWDSPRPIVDLAFTDANGRPLSLGAFRGQTVLLNVWATWCAPCRKEMPALDRLQQALGNSEFEVIALSVDSRGLRDVQPFYEDVGVKELDIFIDEEGSAMRLLRVIGLPTTLLIDEQGREIGRKQGPAAWDSDASVAFLSQLVSKASVPTEAPPD